MTDGATKVEPPVEPDPPLYVATIAATGIDPEESSRELIVDMQVAKAALQERLGR